MDEADELLSGIAEALFETLIRGHFSSLVEMELTLSQAQVLQLLHLEPKATGALAANLGISPPAVTQLCDRLLSKKLIRRRESDVDRRSVMVELTEPGRAAMEILRTKRMRAFAEMMTAIEPDAREVLMRGLTGLAGIKSSAVTSAAASESKPARLRQQDSDVQSRETARPDARVDEPRTAADAHEASKESDKGQQYSARRRIRIEWD